ncbi:MAG: hypothetical protein V2I27_12775 [Erythrobacter sp.]|jgi:hypothetical protein|nr:hypothetical protein [Erythrobacter sp.]
MKMATRFWPSGGAAALVLFAGLLAAKAAALQFDHSLLSIDGVLQTWFALDNFAAGNQLGREFQSYLGITLILALVPAYLAFGQTLFASTLAANLFVLLGSFATAYAIAWFVRPIARRHRWAAALGLILVFFYVLPVVGDLIEQPWPLAFEPGHSLRPVRGYLPFFVLPVFVFALRAILARASVAHAFALGLVAGAGLLWSNDAGIPLVLALAIALGLALLSRPVLMLRGLLAFIGGCALGAAIVLLLVTHGEPGAWLRYNFVDVAGDQIWYFGPWDREARILAPLDLIFILRNDRPVAALTLVLLTASVAMAAVRLLLRRGSRVHGAAFVFVGASLIGTALVPQIGGHVGSGYSDVTVFFGACAPFIVSQRVWLPLVRPAWRAFGRMPLRLAAWGAVLLMLALEGAGLAGVIARSERTVYVEPLGFRVSPAYAADLAAMRELGAHWRARGIAPDRQLLSVYASALDIAADSESPTAVGSLIHALGPGNRADFAALVERREVAGVTTIAPDFSGWEGWLSRANPGFFAALNAHYRPIGRNDQHVVWVRREEPVRPLADRVECRASGVSQNALELELTAPHSGIAQIDLVRSGPMARRRSAILTVTEQSPFAGRQTEAPWLGFPRYGAPNAARLPLEAPVEAGTPTRLRLELLDGSPIGTARCSASLREEIDFTRLPAIPEAVARQIAQERR